MSELADLELSGRIPAKTEKEVELFQDYGYYYDYRGIKRFGVIPTNLLLEQTKVNDYDDPFRIETSDPRIYELLLRNGVRWGNED